MAGVTKKISKVVKNALEDIFKVKGQPGIAENTRPYTDAEKAVYKSWGKKAVDERARQRAVSAAAGEPKKSRKRVGDQNKSAVDPFKFRVMEKEKGPESVLNAARAGQHLIRTESGYVGAPRTVTSPTELARMRRRMDRDVVDAARAIELADPENLGKWYINAKAGQAAMNEPYMLPRSLEQHGAYSQGVAPQTEISSAITHHNSRMIGEPQQPFYEQQAKTLDEAVANDVAAKLGPKTGVYASKQDPRTPPGSLFGTNDFRQAQHFGYTEASGAPYRGAPRDTMHPFMDAETALAVDRANRVRLGGINSWTGDIAQEVPWIFGKGQDLYRRGSSKKGRFSGEPIEGMKAAIREANKTPADFFPDRAFSATYEYAPGRGLGHLDEAYGRMTPEERLAFENEGRWDLVSPEVELMNKGLLPKMPGDVGAGRRDVLYSALGLRQLPTFTSSGAFKNAQKEWEFNKLNIAPVLTSNAKGKGAEGDYIEPLQQRALAAVERFRALMDAQQVGAGNLPNTMDSLSGKNSFLMDTGAVRATPGRQPTSEQMRDILRAIGDRPVAASASNRGVAVFPFDRDMPAKQFAAIQKDIQPGILAAFPGAKLKRGKTSSVYEPALTKYDADGNLVPTTPFSGEATEQMLRDFAALPHEFSLKLSESEAARKQLGAKVSRDDALRAKGESVREDLQNARKFFRDADWPKAVEMIRKGASVATALSALGYSASAMASPSDK